MSDTQLAGAGSPDPIPGLGLSCTDDPAEATLESAAGRQTCCFVAPILADFVLVLMFMQELAERGGHF